MFMATYVCAGVCLRMYMYVSTYVRQRDVSTCLREIQRTYEVACNVSKNKPGRCQKKFQVPTFLSAL